MINDQHKTYRNTGAIGALLDEYERALFDLIRLIEPIPEPQLSFIVDRETRDDDCRSIQTILTHVVRAGFAYATYIRIDQGEELAFRSRQTLESSEKYIEALNQMFQFTAQVFEVYPSLRLEENDENEKMLVSWGQRYDVEQLMEHAIVHILRHRRQIERFLRIIENRS